MTRLYIPAPNFIQRLTASGVLKSTPRLGKPWWQRLYRRLMR